MMETMLKTLLKSVDVEKLMAQALSDPKVQQALELAKNISADFAALKKGQEEILARLDKIDGKAEIHPAQDELFDRTILKKPDSQKGLIHGTEYETRNTRN